MNKIKEFIKKTFSGFFEKKVVFVLVSGGVTVLLAQLGSDFFVNVAIRLINYYIGSEIIPIEKVDNLSDGFKWVGIILGTLMILGGIVFYFYSEKKKGKRKALLQIAHTSIESVAYTNFDVDLDDYEIEQHKISLKEELKTLNKGDLGHAIRVQSKIVQEILQRADGRADTEASYWGLAHVPLTFLLGYQMADKLNTSFYEWNQNEQKWNKVKEKNASHPDLLVSKKLNQPCEEVEDVVIKIGITYPIDDITLIGLGLEGADSYYLHIPSPKRNAIVSVKQLNEYQSVFRKTLDEINQSYPNLKKVHIFYSGQPSLAYRLGSCISPRMDKDIWVYNYNATSHPKYPWSISMKKEWRDVQIHVTGDNA